MLGPLTEIIVYVTDMESQVRFYRDTLKLPISYPCGLASYAEEFWVTFNTGACTLALHGGGRKEFGNDAPKFVFQVDDIAAVRAALLDSGVRLDEIRSPAPGVSVVDGRDSEGNAFSLESRE